MTQWANLPGRRQTHVNPAWFIPVVGDHLLTPLAGPNLGSVRWAYSFPLAALAAATIAPEAVAAAPSTGVPLPAQARPAAVLS